MNRLALLVILIAFLNIGYAQTDFTLTPVFGPAFGVVEIKNAGDGSNRLFLVKQSGQIEIYKNGTVLSTPFLDIASKVVAQGEQGLLSLAFPPGNGPKAHFYVYYTKPGGASVIERYRVSSNPDLALASSGEVILEVPQPFDNHNGGRLLFGPDGFLYFGFGDGGSANDPLNMAQNTGTLLGKIIRIDVEGDASPYAIPADNPFVGNSAVLDEIWALGLRNPWKMAFDSATGDLFIADVGQSRREEVNFQAADSSGGENYGWPQAEGDLCSGDCSGFVEPVAVYDHQNQNCSITGGEVYRGQLYPALQGMYFYGDLCSTRLWGLQNVAGEWEATVLSDAAGLAMTTFGKDELGNVYACCNGATGQVYVLSDGAPVGQRFPLSGRMSGYWIGAGLNDQAMVITADETANGQPFIFFTWYLYENGQPLWLVGNEVYTPGDSQIVLPVIRLSGLEFIQPDPQAFADREQIGTLTITAETCEQIKVDFQLGSLGSGDQTLQRAISVSGAGCP